MILAVLFMVFIVELIRRDKLLERYSIVWFAAGAVMIIGALVPQPLELLANVLGVRDLTIALFSLVLIVLLALALNFSVIASRHTRQITRLAQERAVETLQRARLGRGARRARSGLSSLLSPETDPAV